MYSNATAACVQHDCATCASMQRDAVTAAQSRFLATIMSNQAIKNDPGLPKVCRRGCTGINLPEYKNNGDWGSERTFTATRPRWSCSSNGKEMAEMEAFVQLSCRSKSDHRLVPQPWPSTASCWTCYSRSFRKSYVKQLLLWRILSSEPSKCSSTTSLRPRIHRLNAIILGRCHTTLGTHVDLG